MSSLFSKTALGLALGAALAGCAAAHGSSVAAGSMAAATARATAGPSLSPAATPAAESPAQPRPATSPALTAASVADVGVVAACDAPAPLRLSTEPSSIILACADDNLGIQDLSWTSWSAKAATGTGLLWENLCEPNCADGTLGHYPVAVTLSAVRESAKGPWFSHLSLTWRGSRPGNQTPDAYPLMPPTP